MLNVSRRMLSLKLLIFFTRKLETGFAGTGNCDLPGMASKKKNKMIQPRYFKSSSFSDMAGCNLNRFAKTIKITTL
jgi:hypothetical protein